jgi:hypothetical protein
MMGFMAALASGASIGRGKPVSPDSAWTTIAAPRPDSSGTPPDVYAQYRQPNQRQRRLRNRRLGRFPVRTR